MHVSAFTPHQCSFVHIQVRAGPYFYPHASALTRRMWDNTARHWARVLKLPRGK